jgi:signal peptidase
VRTLVQKITWRLPGQVSELLLILFTLSILLAVIYLHIFGWRFDAVLTGSMSPTYRIGGMVVVRPVDPYSVKVGDVITFKPPFANDFLITHRVIERDWENNSLGFLTQGDGVDRPDGYFIPAENVRGTVLVYLPFFGYFAEFVKTPLGILVCLILPSALIIGDELWKKRHKLQRKMNGYTGGHNR